MLKAPHPIGSEECPERLEDYVATLELVRDLLTRALPSACTAALILVDALSDGVMFRLATEEFANDRYLASIMPPKYSPREQRQTEYSFDQKLVLMVRLGVLEADQASTLAIAHYYRNGAYHRAQIGQRIAGVLCRASLQPLLALLRRLFAGRGFGGSYPWLARLGLPTTYLDTDQVIAAAERLLPLPDSSDLEVLRKSLMDDLESRRVAIKELRTNELFEPSEQKLDEILREEEWADACDEMEASKKLREQRYQIVAGAPPSREEYLKSERQFLADATAHKKSFVPTLTALGLTKTLEGTARLQTTDTIPGILDVYHTLDLELRPYERILMNAANRLDHAIQSEIDRRRGK